ncbi:interferon-induced very large GTPase 1-like [Mercenaria mercenaria]|uniref:interferon-induced very large GTPase 1-like n=1 Tax=Mercenaria mercenaria TaxID=6596 RepID=UPI00234F0157|nr:interferon-induced very large GTPase 1-like [Mercenaria mercenaria]XP_053386961.1 interferon-induced very large GTPase 1-like [Mercenaria mercenaria]XP_053386962.1 interferon-induced very large GTPase 1-like [Mercenaria mercenaria]
MHIPLVIKPEQLEPPTVYLWPTLGLISKHLSTNLLQSVEDNISSIGFKIVSFLRFNNYDVSKSHILNLLINKTEKVHSVFYHRNCAASVEMMSEVCHGMIEIFPHLDNEKEPVLFLNLRGQCNVYQNQNLFLLKVSHVVFLVCSKAETHLIKDFIKQDIGKSCEKIVIIFLDLDINEESDAFLSQLDSFSEKLCVSNHLVGYKGMSHSDLRKELITPIKSVKGRHNFDDIKAKAEEHHFSVDLNKIDDALKRSEILSNLVFQMFKEQTLECIFPVQGHLCSEWCKTDLEKYKLRLRGNTENIGKYRKRLEMKQNELRSQQLQLITEESCKTLHLFVNNISRSEDIEDVEVFLRNLKLSIEMATRSTRLKAHEEYRNLFEKLRMMSAQTDDIHKEFRLLDEKLENQSLSFLDFSREMGHMYEILIDKNINQEYQKKLLDIAVTILRCGYEIEIMDGRSNWVPIIWVQSILLEIRRRLGNVRIKVITVLGVQSSGKSTLLNIMFGTQFAVGSGRCTRGMYMHLVKVSDKVSREYMVDYLLVIDTEGLYSSITKVDETNERDKTERELATFAIGMSHVTVVNIMGEDMTYLHEILPITVHAFLRMDLVGLRPKCKLLHHTVEKSSNDKLLQNTFSLERILDEHTATACTLENIPKKRFRDIIHFDSIEDVYFFSPLFEIIDDLKIVSSLYSKDAAHLKEKLILDTESVGTLEELANHVDLLWNAVKKDDFVFEFRDTVETQARVALDKRVCHLQWKSKREFLRVLMEFRTEIKSCDTLEKVNEVQQRYTQSINCTTNEQIKANADDLLVADFAQDRLRTHAMQRLLESSKITIEDYTQECRLYCDSQIERDVTLRMKELEIQRCSEFAFIQIDEFLDKHVSVEPSSTLSDTSSRFFDKWLGELSHKSSYGTLFNLEEDAIEAIYKIFGTRRTEIDKPIQSKDLNERQIDTFINEIPEILSSTNVRLVAQLKQKLASEVAEDIMLYVKHVLFELQRRNIFYEPNIFKDISLQVRSHRHISSGSLQTKPNFEIELVLYVCGEFIQRFRKISEKDIILSNGLMKTAQSYFLSRCRQKSNYCTNTTQAVKDFTNVLIEEIGLAIIAFLPQELANSIKEDSYFLQSKQLFLIHSYIKMLDNKNILHAYLSSFEAGAVYIISNVYESMLRTSDAVQKIIRS